MRSITQHNKRLDFSLPDFNRLEGEFNYQVWSFRMAMIFERHRIWTFFINLKTQGVIPKAKHEGKKITVDVINARFLDFGH